MPRDSNGNFSLVPSYLAVTGQTIMTSQYNPVVEDIANALTGSVPRAGTAPMLANLPMGGFKLTGMANGTAATDGATKGQVESAAPVGIVVDFAGSVAPTGWLLCYGQLVSRTDYAALFAVIGVNYSAGDGTTFGIPDLRGCVTAGLDNMGGTDAGRLSTLFGSIARTLGGFLGVASHVLTISQIPSHDHGGETGPAGAFSWIRYLNLIAAKYIDTGQIGWDRTQVVNEPAHSHSIAAQGGGEAHPNAQPTAMINKIIKAV